MLVVVVHAQAEERGFYVQPDRAQLQYAASPAAHWNTATGELIDP